MKSAVITFLATIVATLSASALPALLLEASIAKQTAHGATEVLSQPNVIVESGKQATIRSGKLEYSLTPKLLDNGTVDIQAVITEYHGEKAVVLAKPRMIVEPGKEGSLTMEQRVFTIRASLAK